MFPARNMFRLACANLITAAGARGGGPSVLINWRLHEVDRNLGPLDF